MGAIISSLVSVRKDVGGNPFTEAWLLVEFRNQYVPGGEAIDLSSILRRVDQVVACTPASGALRDVLPRENQSDYPADARSGRLEIWQVPTSGVGISITSGTEMFLSGKFLSGTISGQTFTVLISGRIAGQAFAEMLSGVQTSGARARIYVVGY